MTVLFVCSRNVLRSPTAEEVFREHPGIFVASAGLSKDAVEPLTPELVRWADIIFVMEKRHRTNLSRSFRRHLNGQRVVCLDIPDTYEFMEPALVALLRRKVTPFLPATLPSNPRSA